ncbi:MAG: DUF4097 family beta strand repeat-containing protein [Pyrinomonadaceae bacterium]
MSWLISLLIAGAMFSAENNLPVLQTNNNSAETSAVKTAKADETERFEQTYPLSANGKVSVSNVNGSITIEGWDRPEVKLAYVKTADTKEHLSDAQVKIDAQKDSLDVETEYNSSWNRGNKNVRVEFRLMVPRAAALSEIQTVNGSINISNTTNLAKISAVNGEVKALNLRGAAELSTVNGTVTADFEQLDNTSRISLETVNGRAFLTLPSDANATVRAETTNGKITDDFGLPVRQAKYGGGSSLYGKIGTGDVKIKLESVNGELSVRRRADGKNPNPVTNLLSSNSYDLGNIGQRISDEVVGRISQRIKAQALEEARKEVENSNPNASNAEKEALILKKAQEKEKIMLDKMRGKSKSSSDGKVEMPEMNIKMPEINIKMPEIKIDVPMMMRDADWFQGVPSVERKSENFPVTGVPFITVNGGVCSVKVRGWDKPEVQYNFTRVSKDPNATPSLIAVGKNESQIKIDVTETKSDNIRLELEIFAPKKSNLQIVSDDDIYGGIRVENVSGDISIEGSDSPINVRDGEGKLNITNGAGAVRVIGFRGAVEAETGDGTMSFEGDFQKLTARTESGAIILTLPENADATIESNNENINAEGFALVRQDRGNAASTWKIGNGGKTYLLYTDSDGKIFVRNSDSLKIK